MAKKQKGFFVTMGDQDTDLYEYILSQSKSRKMKPPVIIREILHLFIDGKKA